MSMATPASTSSTSPRGSRITMVAPVAGIAFVVLFVLSFMMMFSTPDGDEGDRAWTEYWLDADHRNQGTVSALSMALAAVAFLWLIGGLRRRLGGAVGADAAYGAGIAMAVLMLIAAFGAAVIPVGHEIADIPIPVDPDVIRLIDGSYFGVIFLPLTYAMAAFLIPLFWATRAIDLPSWLRISALVIGLLALTGPLLFFIPHLLFLLWILALSITVLMREGSSA